MPQPLVFDPDTTFSQSHKFWRWFKGVGLVLLSIGFAGCLKLIFAEFLLRPGTPAIVELLARGAAFFCLGLAIILACARPRYYHLQDGERVLLRYRVIEKMRSVWWVTAPLWPGYIVGLLMLLQILAGQQANPTSPFGVVLGVFGVLICALITGAMFFTVREIRADDEGIRVLYAYFIEWENISRVLDLGNRYAVFHRAYPPPLVYVRKDDPEIEAFFRRQLGKHNLPIETDASFDMLPEMLRYVAAAVVLFVVTLVAWLLRGKPDLLIAMLSLYVGIMFTSQIGKWRGLTNVTRVVPPIDRASLRWKPGQKPPAPAANKPPIPEP